MSESGDDTNKHDRLQRNLCSHTANERHMHENLPQIKCPHCRWEKYVNLWFHSADERNVRIIVYIRSIYVPSVQVRVMCTAAYIRSICSLSAVERDKYDTLHKKYMSLQCRWEIYDSLHHNILFKNLGQHSAVERNMHGSLQEMYMSPPCRWEERYV